MGQPYIGEIRLIANNFVPNGWLACEGQLLPVAENEVLFQLIGTTYGGDGEETFALPDLRGRAPIHMGTGPDGTTYQLGEMAGTEQETLTVQQIPSHNHPLVARAGRGTADSPAGGVPAVTGAVLYSTAGPDTSLAAAAVGSTGGSQPHENMMPYLAIKYIISLFGIFPSQT